MSRVAGPWIRSSLRVNPMPTPLAKMVRYLSSLADPSFDPRNYNAGASFDFSGQASLLSISLQVAVPLHFEELMSLRRRVGLDTFWTEIQRIAKASSDVLAETGDALMFRVKGKTAKAFNALAAGIACLAFAPSGVTVFGTHWEFKEERISGRQS